MSAVLVTTGISLDGLTRKLKKWRPWLLEVMTLMPMRWEPVSAMVGIQVIGGSLPKVVNMPIVGAPKPGIKSIRSMDLVGARVGL